MATLEGSTLPGPILAPSNEAIVYFKTGYSYTAKGWNLTWSEIGVYVPFIAIMSVELFKLIYAITYVVACAKTFFF